MAPLKESQARPDYVGVSCWRGHAAFALEGTMYIVLHLYPVLKALHESEPFF